MEIGEVLGRAPGGFEWWANIVLPAVAAIASLLVLAFSVYTANKAREQATLTEEERKAAEKAREHKEHAERMRAAFAAIFSSISALDVELRIRAAEFNIPFRHIPDTRVLSDIAAGRLEASSEEERRLLNMMRRVVLQTRKLPILIRAAAITEIWRLVIEWSESDDAYRNSVIFPRFEELAALTAASPIPSWVETGE